MKFVALVFLKLGWFLEVIREKKSISYGKKAASIAIAICFFVAGCNLSKNKSFPETNADLETRIKSQNDYFLSLRDGDFVPLNRILNYIDRLNGKAVRTRGVFLLKDGEILISDRECPIRGGVPQLRELYIRNEGVKKLPSSGSYVEVSGELSSQRVGLNGIWPGSLSMKDLNLVKTSDQDCNPL